VAGGIMEILHLGSILAFGPYKGILIAELLKIDSPYLLRLLEEDDYILGEDVLAVLPDDWDGEPEPSQNLDDDIPEEELWEDDEFENEQDDDDWSDDSDDFFSEDDNDESWL
jgi:hypothetical protein